MTPKPELIFTYGTLRPGLGSHPEAQEICANAKHIGPATFQGKLYAIDWYPAAVDSSDPSDVVIGDLLHIGGNADVFEKLDIYEGCSPRCSKPHEFIRVIRSVAYSGRIIPAWLYIFNHQIIDQERIAGGDFAKHVSISR